MMNNSTLRHIIRIALLLLLQGLLIDNLHWMGVFHPFIYILALFMLPASVPRWAEMLIGTGVGLIMDAMYSSAGVHMAACVAICYIRPLLLRGLVQDVQRLSTQVNSAVIGKWQMITLMAILTVVHHGLVFFLEAWNMHHVAWLLLTTLCSAATTIILGLLYDHTQR